MRKLSLNLFLAFLATGAFAEDWVAAQTLDATDANARSLVYRVNPNLEGNEMLQVPPGEIKAGSIYNYYHAGLGRRVWGVAIEGGGFNYAFGEGTTMPVDRFDLRVSTEAANMLLEETAPGLQRALQTTGHTPALLLTADGWTLLKTSSSPRVFDLATGQRWEWHGARRKAVLHTTGDRWQRIGNRYVPVTPLWTGQQFTCTAPAPGHAVAW